MQLLRVDSSARGRSVTRRLTGAYRTSWLQQNPGSRVVERDLARTPLPHITDDWSGTFSPAEQLTSSQRTYLAPSDELTGELLTSDAIVIGAPMYNFTVSWELKAWLDQIVRLGKTVGRGPQGLRGLAGGRDVTIVTASGGDYSTASPRARFDHLVPYLRDIFSFIGIDDVRFVHADRQLDAAGPESLARALEAAAHSAMLAVERQRPATSTATGG